MRAGGRRRSSFVKNSLFVNRLVDPLSTNFRGNVMNNFLKKVAALSLVSIAPAAFAVPVDLTTLMTAVDFSTATTAILAVCAAMIVVYIAFKAAKMVIGAVKGA